MQELTEEKTYTGNCDLCGNKNTQVRTHHLIPRRLLKRIPKRMAKRWELQKLQACNRCNDIIHIENKLIKQMASLRAKLKELGQEEQFEAENDSKESQ